MKRRVIFVLAALLIFGSARADEGMWLPMLIDRLNYEDMQKKGLELTAEEIYSVNQSSLKDAIVIFGGGCTGSIISQDGLLLTNHHCGYSWIQRLSSAETEETNFLKNGYWAMTKEAEIPAPDLSVRFLVSMEDITEQVLKEVQHITDEFERIKAINAYLGTVAKEAEEGTHYQAVARDFFAGNAYYLFLYEVFTDVRFVGAPPQSIGKFGADTDNWMWPRHTGDFSLFRVYTGADGNPAPYAKDNITLKPKHALPVSTAGVNEDDFSLIFGYPGATERYLTSHGIQYNLDMLYPVRIQIRRAKLDVLDEDMATGDALRLMYATKHAQIANYWKNFIGMSKALKKLDVYGKKQETEQRLHQWINASTYRKEKYGATLIKDLEAYYSSLGHKFAAFYAHYEAFRSGSDALNMARYVTGLVKLLDDEDVDQERLDNAIKAIENRISVNYKDYNKSTDLKLLAATLESYINLIPEELLADVLKDITKKYKGDYLKYAEKAFKKSIFANPEELRNVIASKKSKAIKKDMLYELVVGIDEKNAALRNDVQNIQVEGSRLKRLFLAALMEMGHEKIFYPDANSTLRLSYGTVKGYFPRDGVEYLYYTTIEGVMEKEDPNNWEFIVPEKLTELYEAKDYGNYDYDGEMRICFLTDHDITGGNSGSPVLNGKGELIGLAFDGNWEAMSGDIHFEPELQRTINVDVRYILFIIDKFGGAKHLVDEMTLVRSKRV
ncbi:MAG: S46 family peptidase, partial [Bacteroidales bacterium]|nr:S46 family peptidase [Bacteroidales bacterium]